MPAGKYNIILEQGSTFERTFTWYDASGDPEDLTGFTAILTVADSYGGAALVELTESAGITLGGALGTIDVLISKTQTAGLDSGGAVWELTVTDAGGDDARTRLLEGVALVTPQVAA